MRIARLITIGTEITCGEVINSNASWISLRLEEMGVRVYSHLSVRDQRDEIERALNNCQEQEADLIIVTGGLGPTSDDLTREALAAFWKCPLEFDDQVWGEVATLYQQRGLPLREAHRHQCHFPAGSERLKNPTGTALGFYMRRGKQDYFVLPGPPRELEGMWNLEVEPRLRRMLPQTPQRWVRWTCLGAPESEIAELVEKVIAGHGVEVGYRAQVPYVRVKVFVDPVAQSDIVASLEQILAPFIAGRGDEDLANEFLERFPGPALHIRDSLTGTLLIERLLKAGAGTRLQIGGTGPGISLSAQGEEFEVEIALPAGVHKQRKTLPYKLKLDSERGKRSAVEWALWFGVLTLRNQPSTSA